MLSRLRSATKRGLMPPTTTSKVTMARKSTASCEPRIRLRLPSAAPPMLIGWATVVIAARRGQRRRGGAAAHHRRGDGLLRRRAARKLAGDTSLAHHQDAVAH